MKYIRTRNGKCLAPISGAEGGKPELLFARDRVGLFGAPPDESKPMDLEDFMARVHRLEEEIKGQLVAMDEEIELALTGLLAGENVFLLSLPGAAKSTLARMLAQGVDGQLFRINLNPDVSRNDLFGALDPNELREGRWGRRLSGLATAHVAIIDELLCAVVA